ncbi:MAG: hypothetical protein MUO50_05960 [Longimicrobiales bacterium]|nr:hypothetical protein [Longimicrobiales bacterium]
MAACVSPVENRISKWEGTLVPTPLSTITGAVVAASQFGRTELSILIEDAEIGTTYGWRIDSGDCQEIGVIQGGPAQYPRLVPEEGGTVSEQTAISKVFRADGEYAARVFRPWEGASEEVMACGDLHPVQ